MPEFRTILFCVNFRHSLSEIVDLAPPGFPRTLASVAEQKFVKGYTRHPQHFKQLGFEPSNQPRTYAQLH